MRPAISQSFSSSAAITGSFPVDEERAVLLNELDDYLKTILKFKLREFIHLSPCFEAVPSIDVRRYPIDIRNYRRLLSLEQHFPVKGRSCPHKNRIRPVRRRVRRFTVV